MAANKLTVVHAHEAGRSAGLLHAMFIMGVNLAAEQSGFIDDPIVSMGKDFGDAMEIGAPFIIEGGEFATEVFASIRPIFAKKLLAMSNEHRGAFLASPYLSPEMRRGLGIALITG